MEVVKRDKTREEFDSSKLQKVLDWACEGLTNVKPLDILIEAKLNVFDGIKTSKIHEALISSATQLIDIKHTDYEYVAGRLLSMYMRKQIFGVYKDNELPTLKEVFDHNTKLGFYDPTLLDKFDEKTLNKIEKLIDHKNDMKLPYSAYKKIMDSYSVQDRAKNKYVYETPQYMFMFISMFFGNTYEEVRDNYELFINKSASYPTPVLSGARTTTKQYASCAVIEVGDSLESLASSVHAGMRLVAKKFGKGYGFGRLRSEGSPIRNGEVKHSGVIPLYRLFQAATKGFSQGGVRDGSATAYFPVWCREVENLIPLKNDKGSEDTRVKNLDYCITNHGYFLKRMLKNEKISLFSTSDVPGLYELYGLDGFEELYEKYENDESIERLTVDGLDLLVNIQNECLTTGRFYHMFIDNVNKQNRFLDPIRQSNLCFSGDTLVATADGRNAVRIDELAKESNGVKKFPVFSARINKVNKNKWVTEVKNAVAFKTGDKKLVEITLSNGDKFKCTENHLLALEKGGEYIEAGKSLGFKLEKFFTYTPIVGETGYRHINSISNGYAKQHLMMWKHHHGEIPKNHHIDHIENNLEYRDLFENLQLLSKEEHLLKVSKEVSGDNNMINKLLDKDIYHQNRKISTGGVNNSRSSGINNFDLIEHGKKIILEYGELNHNNYVDYFTKLGIKYPKYLSSKYRFNKSWKKYVEYCKGLDTYNGEFEPKENLIKYENPNKELKELTKKFIDSDLVVINIEYLDEVVPVYDLCVEDNHNFYIITSGDDLYKNSRGLLVHNCVEIVLPTEPLESIDDENGEIALCNIGAVNLDVVKSGDYTLMRKVCHTMVRNIDFIIDQQNYYVKASEKQLLRRSLGIGVTNFAYWLASMGLDYSSKESLIEIDRLFEHFQYYLLEGSMLLAKEKGAAPWFHKTRYAQGFLPIDEMNEEVQKLIDNRQPELDWEKLRKDIKKHGLRNSVLSAQMPVESSSLVTSSTNGIQPPRDLITIKTNKVSGNNTFVVPNALELAGKYTLAWDFTRNTQMLNVVGIMQKWIDQAISVDRYYNKSLYSNGLIPMKEMIEDVVQFYKQGGKCLYYTNIMDQIDYNEDDCESCKL